MVRPNDTKERLLDAALQILWNQSLSATSVDAICEKAGVRKGSFYHFFKSKEELVAAALEARCQGVRPELDRIFSSTVPPVERLKSLFEFMYRMQSQKAQEAGRVVGCPYTSVGSSLDKADEMIRKKVQEILATQFKYLESAIRDGKADGSIPVKDVTAATEIVFEYIEGAMTTARLQNDLKPVKNLARGVFALLGVKSEKGSAARA